MVRLLLLLGTQVSCGMTVIRVLSRSGSPLPSIVPASFVLGATLFSSSSLRGIDVESFIPMAFALGIVGVKLVGIRQSRGNCEIGHDQLTGTVHLFPLAMIMCAVSSQIILYDPQRSLFTLLVVLFYLAIVRLVELKDRKILLIPIGGLFFTIFSIVDANSRVSGTWLYPLLGIFRGTDDIVFSESMSWSLHNFGVGNNLAAVGINIKYHWFSLIWSGDLAAFVGLKPLVASSTVVPFVGVLLAGIALASYLRRFGIPQSVVLMSLLFFFVARFGPDSSPIFFVMNTTNLFGIFLLLTLLLQIELTDWSSFPCLVVLTFLSLVCIGVKVPTGLLAVGAVAVLVLVNARTLPLMLRLLLVSLMGLASISMYLLFVDPPSWSQIGYKVLALPTNQDLLFDGVKLSLIPILGILLPWRLPIGQRRTSGILAAIAGFYSVLRFLVDGQTGEVYFLISGLAILIPIALRQAYLDRKCLAFWMSLFAGIMIGLTPMTGVATFTVAYLCASFLAVLSLLIPFRSHAQQPPRLALINGIFIGLSCAFGLTGIVDTSTRLDRDEVVTSAEYSMMSEISELTNGNSVIGTNRYLCDSNICDFDDSSHLISAISHRSVFIEGPRFVSGGRPYADWIQSRIRTSVSAGQGEPAALRKLRDSHVTHFWLDRRFGGPARCNLLGQILLESDYFCFVKLTQN